MANRRTLTITLEGYKSVVYQDWEMEMTRDVIELQFGDEGFKLDGNRHYKPSAEIVTTIRAVQHTCGG